MSNILRIPELKPMEVAALRASTTPPILLDVREPHEHQWASLGDGVVTAPLSHLAAQGLQALPLEARDPQAHLIIFCHHGVRSAQVVLWLRQQGWNQVYNLQGGIDAWASDIDASVGRY